MNSWVPISCGKYPPLLADVQVTYEIGSMASGHKYYKCDMFAYVVESEDADNRFVWRDSNSGVPIDAKVIAWRFCNDAYNPESKTASNKYDSTVRKCMSDEYVRVSKERTSLMLKMSELQEQLHDKNITHSDYIDKEKYLKSLEHEIEKLSIQMDTWGAAREICLNVVDGGISNA